MIGGAVLLALVAVIGAVLAGAGGEEAPRIVDTPAGSGSADTSRPDPYGEALTRARTRITEAIEAGDLSAARHALDDYREAIDEASEARWAEAADRFASLIAEEAADRVVSERKAFEGLLAQNKLDKAKQLLERLRASAGDSDALNEMRQALDAARDKQRATQKRPPPGTATEITKEHLRECETLLARGQELALRGQTYEAVQCYLKAAKLVPGHPTANLQVAVGWFEHGKPEKAVPWADKAIVAFERQGTSNSRDKLAEAYVTRACIHEALYDFAKATADFARCQRWLPGYQSGHYRHSEMLERQGKYAEALAQAEAAFQRGSTFFEKATASQQRCMCLVGLKRHKTALLQLRWVMVNGPQGAERQRLTVRPNTPVAMVDERNLAMFAWINHVGDFGASTPTVRAKAREIFLQHAHRIFSMRGAALRGRWLSSVGDHREAVRYLGQVGHKLRDRPLAALALGTSLHALGKHEKAQEYFAIALRWQPGLKAKIEALGAKTPTARASKLSLGDERVAMQFVLRHAEAWTGDWRCARAAAELERLASWHEPGAAQDEVRARAARARALDTLHGRIVAAIAAGKRPALTLDGKSHKITRATRDALHAAARAFRWALLPAESVIGLIEQFSPTPAERMALGAWCWQHHDRFRAQKLLVAARSAPGMAKQVDALFGAISGTFGPFHVHGERLVNELNLRKIKRGLCSFREKWVTPADRERLLRGERQVGGRWVTPSSQQLRSEGLRLDQGQWLTPDEYNFRRVGWDVAKTREGKHCRVISNAGPNSLDWVALFGDQLCERLAEVLGRKLQRRPTILVFNERPTYLAHVRKSAAMMAHPGRGGGLTRASSGAVCFAYNRDLHQYFHIRRIVRQLGRLYVAECFTNAPAWLSEGVAGYVDDLEFRLRERRVSWNARPKARVLWLQRAAERGHALRPLKQLLASKVPDDARDAATYRARVTLLVGMLLTTDDRDLRARWARCIQEVGKTAPAELLGADLGKVEKALAEYCR